MLWKVRDQDRRSGIHQKKGMKQLRKKGKNPENRKKRNAYTSLAHYLRSRFAESREGRLNPQKDGRNRTESPHNGQKTVRIHKIMDRQKSDWDIKFVHYIRIFIINGLFPPP